MLCNQLLHLCSASALCAKKEIQTVCLLSSSQQTLLVDSSIAIQSWQQQKPRNLPPTKIRLDEVAKGSHLAIESGDNQKEVSHTVQIINYGMNWI